MLRRMPVVLATCLLPALGAQEDGDTASPILHTLEGHRGHVARLALHAEDHLLATAGHDNTVRVWDTTTDELRVTLRTDSQQFAVAISPDGKWLAAAGDRTLRIWKLPSKLPTKPATDPWKPQAELEIPGTPITGAPPGHPAANQQMPGTIWDLAFSPDSKLLAAGTFAGTVELYDTRRFDHLASLAAHHAVSTGENMVEFVAWSPDSKHLVSGGKTAETLLWRIEGRGTKRRDKVVFELPEAEDGPPAHRMCAAFSPDGSTIAIGGTDGTIQLLTVGKSGVEVSGSWRAHPGAYSHHLAFAASPADTLLTVGDDLRIWPLGDDPPTTPLHTLALGGALHQILPIPGSDQAYAALFDGPLHRIRLTSDD